MENKLEISLCGLTLRIKEGDKVTIVDIPDYHSTEELRDIVNNIIEKYATE